MLSCANGTLLLVNVYLGVFFAKLSIFVFYIVTVTTDICVTTEHCTLLKFLIKITLQGVTGSTLALRPLDLAADPKQ